MKKRTKVILFILIVFVGLPLGYSALRKALTPAVGILEITGPIDDSTDYLDIIQGFEDDSGVKAVVVRLDSPGGKVGPSQEIYEALLKLKKKKPVVASMASVAASGAYYIACSADSVYALAGTLTGSIGVILEFFDVTEGMKKLGVSSNAITGGTLKDAGSPFKKMNPEEEKYFRALTEDVHAQFKEAVASSRKIKMETLDGLADGRVFSGRQALGLKLIDKLGGLDDAIDEASRRGGIEGEPRIVWGEPRMSLMQEVKNYLSSYTPISFLKGSTRLSRGFFRLEYSIQ
jgi:protease IV